MTSTAELSSPASANTALTQGVVDADYTLEDKYRRTQGRIYLSGVQALVRLPLAAEKVPLALSESRNCASAMASR